MPARRDLGDGLGDELRDLYQGLERELAAGIARRLTPGIEAQDWAQRRLAAVGEVRRWATGLADRAAGRAGPAATRAVAQAFRRGSMEALRDLGRPERGGDLPGQRGIDRLAGALRGRLDGTAMPIARAATDAYQRTVAQAAANVLGGALTRRGAAERAWNGLLDQGFTAFTDVRGRRWAASGYVEMATRTATAQAAVQGHLDRLESLGLDLVIVSDAPQECKLCRPWEGKVLQRAGAAGKRDIEAESELTGAPVTVHIAGSVAEAIGDGLMHPNAILGDQRAGVLGELENACRAWYVGPSVHLTTRRGHDLTVSPNHPVLTARGWLRADDVQQGDHVFSGARSQPASDVAVPDITFQDGPATFEQVFQALATVGYRQSGPATCDDFHGDGRSYQGEVHVVWTERALLRELDSGAGQQRCERHFVGTDAKLLTLTGAGALDVAVGRVRPAVAGTLPDLDAARDQAPPDRRVADAGTVGEILAGLSCEVAGDEVVHVERDWYSGHAYDLQTSTGAYLTDGIIVHNCRHTMGAYLPGLTRIPTNTADPEGDAARQKLRYLEREQRRWRLREAGALDEKSKAAAAAKVKGRQAEIREHMKGNSTLTRRQDREQIDLSNRRHEGGSAAAPAPRPPVDPLREALDSGIESERQLGGGVSARVDRLQTRSGTPLIRKQVKGASGRDVVEEQDAEELGGLLARAVGARAPRLLRTAPDEVIMAEVRGQALGELDEVARAAAAATEEARSIALADILMANTDRNVGNVIVTEAGTPWAIDHGAAFQFHHEYNPASGVSMFNSQFMERFVDLATRTYRPGTLRPGEGSTLRLELEALRPDFERLGRADWLRDALLRLKALEDA